MQKPYFANYFQVVLLPPDKVMLRSPQRTLLLRGEFNRRILPRLAQELDGQRSLEAVLSDLQAAGFSRPLTQNLLNNLAAQGIIRDGMPSGSEFYREQQFYFEQILPEQAANQARLQQAHILVFGLGGLGSHLLSSLAKTGIGYLTGVDSGLVGQADLISSAYPYQAGSLGRPQAATQLVNQLNPEINFKAIEAECNPKLVQAIITDWKNELPENSPNLVVVTLDQTSPLFYEAVNRVCLDLEQNWTMASFDDFGGIVGPTVIPFTGPCYHCYRVRQQSNSRYYEVQLAYENTPATERTNYRAGQLAAFSPLLANSLNIEIVRLLSSLECNQTGDRVIGFDFFSLKTEEHPVLRVPDCPACGRLAGRQVFLSDHQERVYV